PITRHRSVIAGGIVLCALVFVAGIVLVVTGFRDWKRVKASVNWPTTKAEVIDSRLARSISSPTRFSAVWQHYTLELELHYTVNGADYTSETELPVVAPSPAEADPTRGLMAFVAPGKQFTIHYDPANPTTIIVVRGGARRAWLAMGTGVLLAFIFLFSIWVLRSKLVKPEVEGTGKLQKSAASD
ncbi:MAG TPA: DUF3592 domain-containing protein, partial [Terriglobia bacterium]|nr:DUF3592 domain-containing protein [Terriglobia bacterium]